MRLSSALYACTFLVASPALAQLGIYGTFNAERMSAPSGTVVVTSSSGSTITNGSASASTSSYSPIPTNPIGGTGGIYYDFHTFGPVRLGVDARGTIQTIRRGAEPGADGDGSRINSVLGGVRGSFHTPYEAVKPYVQLSAGYGRTNYGVFARSATTSGLYGGFEYHAFAGVDIKLASLLDLRAIELGYGGITTSGPASSVGPFTLKSVGIGLVIHLPSLP